MSNLNNPLGDVWKFKIKTKYCIILNTAIDAIRDLVEARINSSSLDIVKYPVDINLVIHSSGEAKVCDALSELLKSHNLVYKIVFEGNQAILHISFSKALLDGSFTEFQSEMLK